MATPGACRKDDQGSSDGSCGSIWGQCSAETAIAMDKRTPDQPLPNLGELTADSRAEVLASPAYQERCALLFDLFRLSREAGRDPQKLLVIQAGLIDLLVQMETKQAEFRSENNRLGVAVAKRLGLILRQLADSIAWRALGFDRVSVQLLAEHPATGHLDRTVFNDLTAAQRIVEQEGAIVLVNDLTTVLRHGDLTIVRGGEIAVQETKYGKASRRSRRGSRQRRGLAGMTGFLKTGTRVVDARRDYIWKSEVPIETYEAVAADAMCQARLKGYYQVVASNCLAIEAMCPGVEETEVPRQRPFHEVKHRIRANNLDVFDRAATRIAPYGIFRLDDQDCFDLMTGSILLFATLDIDSLSERFRRVGLSLVLPQPSQQQIDRYLSAPIAQRKRLMEPYRFVVDRKSVV